MLQKTKQQRDLGVFGKYLSDIKKMSNMEKARALNVAPCYIIRHQHAIIYVVNTL